MIRGAAVKTRMWTSAVVEVEIPANRSSLLADGFVSSQIDLLIFEAARGLPPLSTQTATSFSSDVDVEQREQDEAGGNDSHSDEGPCDAIGRRR